MPKKITKKDIPYIHKDTLVSFVNIRYAPIIQKIMVCKSCQCTQPQLEHEYKQTHLPSKSNRHQFSLFQRYRKLAQNFILFDKIDIYCIHYSVLTIRTIAPFFLKIKTQNKFYYFFILWIPILIHIPLHKYAHMLLRIKKKLLTYQKNCVSM